MSVTAKFDVGGMHCDACARTIAKAVERTPGVTAARVGYVTREAEVTYDADRLDAAGIAAVVASLGYTAVPRADATPPPPAGWSRSQKREMALSLAAVGAAFGLMGAHHPGIGHAAWAATVQVGLAVVMAATVGRRYARGAWGAARRRLASMDTLVTLAAGSALLAGLADWVRGSGSPGMAGEATVILGLVRIGGLLRTVAVDRMLAELRGAVAGAPRKFAITRNGI